MGLQSFSATIGGTAKTIRNVAWSSVVNGVGRASFTVDDPTGTYVPADDAAVVLSAGGSPIWGGEVADVEVTYLGESGVSCYVTCHDYNQYSQRTLINGIIASQTLKTTLTTLVTLMPGTSLAAGQVTGPTLGVITSPWWTIETMLNHLSSLTGYVWRINASKELEMWAIGTKSSGVTLSKANANVVQARWRRHRFDYCNRVWVLYGPTATPEFVEDAVEVAARGEWNKVVTAPDILTAAEASAYGDSLISSGLPCPQVPTVVTRADGIDPGETVVVDLSDVGLSSVTAFVQRVDASATKANAQADVEYQIEAVGPDGGSTTRVASALDLWRRMLTGSTGGSAVISGGGGGGGVTTVISGVLEGDLGGSRQVGVSHSTWAPPREWREWECQADGSYTAAVDVWTSNAATSVTPRLYDVTAAAAVTTTPAGSASTSTTPARQSLAFTGTAGHVYRLELLPNNTTYDVFGIGKVRSAA